MYVIPGDEEVTLEEFLQQASEKRNTTFSESDFRFCDKNHDDVITISEIKEMFTRIDANGKYRY